jgi:hypothetical protein
MNSGKIWALLWFAALPSCAESNYSIKHSDNFPNQASVIATPPPAPQNLAAEPEPTSQPKLKASSSSPRENDKALALGNQSWEKISESNEITTYRGRKVDGGVITFRGETVIPAPIIKVAAVLNDVNLRKKWVAGLKESHVIQARSSLDRIEYNRMSVPWPFEDRDFVYHVRVSVSQKPPGISIEMKSIEDPREPKVSGVVRGKIIQSRYIMIESGDREKKTHVNVEMAVDPSGVIPTWVVNLTQRQWPESTLSKMKQYSVQEDLVVPKEIQDYFSLQEKK